MAIAYKVLGQTAPTNTSNANLYTVPLDTQTVVSSLAVANVTAADATFRIYLRVAGATAADSNALAKDVTLAKNSIFSATQGLTLNAGDIITVQSSIENALTFQLFGSEITE